VLVGLGIGSQFARMILPILLALTYALISTGAGLVTSGVLTVPYGAGLTAAGMGGLLHVVVILLARKINDLERALRDLSLVDELTGIHNRRAFYLFGEQALRNARRDARPITVLFFDADGLKKVNDTLGHEVGSQLLVDLAELLRATFRSSDVLGRLGGDEFAVMTREAQAESGTALRRLDDAIEAANAAGKPYKVSFSVGAATAEPQSDESFAELVDRADAIMYQNKRQRRAARDDAGAGSPRAS
jgi:diguanylate cyclase (GGDEF)-like protein